MASPLPLDERVHQHPAMNAWYMGASPDSQFRLPSMDSNMLHRYLSESPFFDWTSKNGLEISHSRSDPWAWQTTHNRNAFEAYLATRSGLEFLVVEGRNCEFDEKGVWGGGGVWVVRKQDRVKGDGEGGRDEVGVLGTYFFVGENVYQAPAVGDVLGMRLLTAATALENLFSEARTLPIWSPTTGHSYLPPAPKPTSTAPNSPTHSRSNSLSREASLAPPSSNATSTADSAKSTSLLLTSLRQASSYPTDYIDENPLLGEPGALTFTSSTTAAKKRIEAAEHAAQLKRDGALSRSATPASGVPAVMTRKLANGSGSGSGSGGGGTDGGARVKKTGGKGKGEKRRKSRMVGGTPAGSPLGGGGAGGG